ncbi:MAG: OsmC family protein [Steroidobacteraceae bacterium]
MKTRVKWVQDMMFVAETGTGHAVVMDGAPEAGGHNLGPRPMELLLVGLGGCSSIDVVMILKRGRAAITDCVVEIEAERAETDPKVFTRIRMHFIVTGKRLEPNKVERAIKLSAEKYCSAAAMLGATAQITHDFEIRDSDAATA